MAPALALYEPDMPGNLGAAMRLGACLDVDLHVIEPCGFPLDDRRLRRAAMDYAGKARMLRHASFAAFEEERKGRLVLLTTRASEPYHLFRFRPGDVLLLGRESSGVPEAIHAAADSRLRIPMAQNIRSINMVNAASMVLGEALRQLDAFPPA